MSAEMIMAITGIVTGVISLFGVVYIAGTKLAKLETKVDTMWDFLLRRAMSEAVNKNIGTINSPFRVNKEQKVWMSGIAPQLVDFYKNIGVKLTDVELMLEIERRYGDWLLKEVCIPKGLVAGACLYIAAEVAKGAPVDIDPFVGADASVNKSQCKED